MSASDSGASSVGRRSVAASPGVPDDEARIAELEARLQRLEGGSGTGEAMRERGRKMAEMIVPADAFKHFRNAGREQLLGFRAIVDFWIHRLDDMERRSTSERDRHTIEIE